MIYRRDDKADSLAQLYLSWFSLAKVIQLAKPITALIVLIVQLPKDMDSVMDVVSEVKTKGRRLISLYMPWVSQIPIHQGISWMPTWKAVPNGRIPKDALYKKSHKHPVRSAFLAQTYELCAYGSMLRLEHSHEAFFSSSILWRPRIRYALDPQNTEFANKDLDWFEKFVGPKLPTFQEIDDQGVLLSRSSAKRLTGSTTVLGRLWQVGNGHRRRWQAPYIRNL